MESMGSDAPNVEANTSKLVFPTSFAQQRLWFLEQLQPGNTSYIVAWSLRIQGGLNVSALHSALNEIIRRHEILRTTFEWKDGMPVQVVADSLSLVVPLVDLSGLGNALAKAEYLRREEAHTPINLEQGPLVRAQLLKLAPEEHVLLLTMHHIIFDGWSRRLFIRELSAFYESFSAGQAPALPAPSLQYGDYAVWQRKHLQGANVEKQLEYWREQLAGIPASLDLPFDHPRPSVQTFNGAKVPVHLSQELTSKISSLGRQYGATPYMTLLAAFQVLLARYSNQDDVVIGSPIANRNRAELEEIIGFFANTLVLRARIADEDTFADVLSQVKETALGAYAHQDIPFERLVEELRPDRNLSQNPLFQVLFSLQNAPRQAFELAGLQVELIDVAETTAKFDLAVFLSEGPDGIKGRLEYNTDLFEAESIARMVDHYRVLLEAAVASPETRISELPILSAEEKHKIVVEWNATVADCPADTCLHDFVARQAERTPQSVALISGKARLTYQEVNDRANQLAHHLMKRGVGPEMLVGVFCERTPEMLIAILGILKAGAAYVPLDPVYPRERIANILQDARASLVLTQEKLVSELPEFAGDVIRLDSDWSRISVEPTSNPQTSVKQDNLAYVLFTSGSTGRPKGVAIEHRSAVTFVEWAKSEFSPRELDGVLFSTSICFDLSVFEMFAPLSVGGKIIVVQNALYLGETPAQGEVTLINTVPSAMAELVRAGAVPRSVKTINLAGEALSRALVDEVYARTSAEKLYNLYGPTEDTTYSTYTLTQVGKLVTIGRPLPGTQAYILDRHRNPVPVGVAGELYLAGAGLARGYFGREDLTAERFVANPFSSNTSQRMYKTGDLCRWLANGEIEYLGRIDHQVKLRGFRIELGEIEAVLAKYKGIRQCVVTARETSPGLQQLVAYVVSEDGEPQKELLQQHLKRSLPEYMVPAVFVPLQELPLTPNGKVDRKALPSTELPTTVSGAQTGPRNKTEELLVKIWMDILQTPSVGVTDNFFDLGGHSLLAVRLVNEIKKATGVEIPLTSLFQGATVEHMAGIVRGTTIIPKAVAHQIQAGGAKRPFFAAVLAGINALGYVPLAKHLGADQPFYTLQSPGPGPRATGRPYTRAEYEAVAEEYVRAMRSVQPKGPYQIGGTCEGARIAFEMTRILEAQGETVSLLAIIDTWVLENTQNKRLWKVYYAFTYFQKMLRQPWKRQAGMVLRAIRNRVLWSTRSSAAPKKSEWIDTYWPGKEFIPPRVQSRITVFRIPRQPFYYRRDPLLGWGERTNSGVDIRVIPDGRHSYLLREPYVRTFAAALREALVEGNSDRSAASQSVSQSLASTQVAAVSQ